MNPYNRREDPRFPELPSRIVNGVTVLGVGSDTGGEELALIEDRDNKPPLGIVSWGYDYGSGVYMLELTDADIKRLATYNCTNFWEILREFQARAK